VALLVPSLFTTFTTIPLIVAPEGIENPYPVATRYADTWVLARALATAYALFTENTFVGFDQAMMLPSDVLFTAAVGLFGPAESPDGGMTFTVVATALDVTVPC
jgi:hypothetical protein